LNELIGQRNGIKKVNFAKESDERENFKNKKIPESSVKAMQREK
jgi:hypothetical protein